ncbi:hypothetical protein AB4072_11150 [Microvirga sp. 2MCAF38]|uniref:hypothetical protein n=1 Tax=Microvirga sp. 2MCAF38 TaxID=3232989 RepID=UPI003F94AA9A
MAVDEERMRVIIVRCRETKSLLGIFWGESRALGNTLASTYGDLPIEYRDYQWVGGIVWESGPKLPLRMQNYRHDLDKYEVNLGPEIDLELAQQWTQDTPDHDVPWEPFLYREDGDGKLV